MRPPALLPALAASALWLSPGTGHAVNKCVGPDGVVTYSDVKCSGENAPSPVKTRQNTFELTDTDRRNAAAEDARRQRDEAGIRRELEAQHEQARRLRDAQEAEEARRRQAWDAQTRSTLPSYSPYSSSFPAGTAVGAPQSGGRMR